MMEPVMRFIVGGSIVALCALIADVVRPKGFAGLFAAAPSVALATLGLTVAAQGPAIAATAAKSMIAGAAGFLLYALACVYVIGMRHVRATPAALGLLAVWGAGAVGLWALWLR